MLRLYLVMFLAIPFVPGFGQSYRPFHSTEKKSSEVPTANQFDHLSAKDGLSNNFVNCILQDRNGFMWFGTNEGLNKYDGVSFTVYKPNPKLPTRSFQSSTVSGLCEGDSDQLWAITEGGGLHEINTRTGIVIPHPIRAPKANRWGHQLSVYKDAQGLLWISTFAGLARYEPARHHFTLYPAPDPEAPIVTVIEDRQHRFWVATLRGLYRFNPETGRFTLIPIPGVTGAQPFLVSLHIDSQDRLWLGTATAGYSLFRLNLRQQPWHLEPYTLSGQLNSFVWRNTIHQDSTGLVWVGTTSGLQRIDPVSGHVITYHTNLKAPNGLSSNSAQAVYHDRSGMLWVGTDNGIDRLSVNTKPFDTYQVTPNESSANFPENRVNALLKDRRGQLWFSNLSTVYRLSASRQLTTIQPDRLGSVGQHKNFINAFLDDGSDGIWFGTYDGLYHLDQASGRYTAYPSTLFVQFMDLAPNGDLWVGGDGGIASFNPRTHQYTYYKQGRLGGLPDKYVNGLIVSRSGEVWVLIKRLGICRLNPKTGQFTRYMAGPRGHLSSNDVGAIYEDGNGIIWIGTHLGGLNRLDPATGLFTVITHQEGIPGNSIVGITSDGLGRLWISTDQGLCRIDLKTNAIHRYEITDGLPSNEFMQQVAFGQAGQLFFGSMNGIVSFTPDRIRDDTHPFPVYINDLTVMGQPRPITDSVIRLRHDENMLSFGFAALAYEQPGQNQYAYQLAGVNPNWVQSRNRHFADYTNLSPGTYAFRVKAANSDGFWTKNVASVQVIVQPPWWATWWAYTLYALASGGAIRGFIRFYANRIRQQQEAVLNRQQAEQLKSVDELKTRFFSNITHEFRTPLSLIIGPVEKILQESRFDRSALTLVLRNADQLLKLINQLLDLSKLEGNYMAISLVQGEVAEFVDQVVALFQRSAEQKGVTLRCIVADFPRHEYVFDADKWEKILTNLLSNALKFTPTGGQVTLTLRPALTMDETTAMQFQLVDSGIGILPEKLPHIFDRFYQADTSNTRAYEGTGIGLALVHELVGLLDGSIAVESQVGVGTTFRLTLPVRAISTDEQVPVLRWSAPAHAVGESLAAPISVLANQKFTDSQAIPRILIVEDNNELREFLVGELASSYHVLQAVDGQEGWEMAQAELPDIVLTDVMMPRMDGHELTQRIKGNPHTDHIAVIILSAKAAQQSRIDGLQQGANDYLIKPFSVSELELRIHNLITNQQKVAAHYRQQFALPHTDSTPTATPNPFLLRIYALLDGHLDDPTISVDWLADQLAMNRKTLYRKVHSLIQLSPADLIRQYRLRKAAELLGAGCNVTETADLVGFSTPSHFSIVFKDFYHQTPSEFMASRARIA